MVTVSMCACCFSERSSVGSCDQISLLSVACTNLHGSHKSFRDGYISEHLCVLKNTENTVSFSGNYEKMPVHMIDIYNYRTRFSSC